MNYLTLPTEITMTDVFTPRKRSQIMSRITSKDTSPETLVRSALHKAGYRYGLHVSDLPGKPDVVLRKYKTVIFINGCFWHQHKGCKRSSVPKTSQEYWIPKLERNVEKQKIDLKELKKLGWKVLIIWECEAKSDIKLLRKISKIK